jgi:hypothetical protein
MDHYGFDTSTYSFTYAAGWAEGDKDVLKQGMEDIKKVSGILIDAIAGADPEYGDSSFVLGESEPGDDEESPSAGIWSKAPDEHLEAAYEDRQSGGDDDIFWSKSSELYERYATELERERRRLVDLEERGVKALSRYDIEIAAGGDVEKALATAKYLVGNHIAYFSSKLEGLDPPAKQQSLF